MQSRAEVTTRYAKAYVRASRKDKGRCAPVHLLQKFGSPRPWQPRATATAKSTGA
jgi:hypothetical protein